MPRDEVPHPRGGDEQLQTRSSHRSRVRDDGRRPRKAAEALAHRIEGEIIAAGWPVGRLLGAEPELIERYGVSRMVMREAIRILENHMIARMRRGPGGGLIVTAPDPSVVTKASALYLDFQRAAPHHLYNARSALELKCIELLATTLDDHASTVLRSLVNDEAGYTPRELIEHSDHFHLVLAELSGDPALSLFVGVLTELTGEWAPEPELGIRLGGSSVLRTREDHAAIAEALLSADTARALELMVDHLSWITGGMIHGHRGH